MQVATSRGHTAPAAGDLTDRAATQGAAAGVLRIVHVNDTHNQWIQAATVIRELRRRGEADVLLHGGDVNLGAAGAEASVRLMNALGFDAVALGNHEFDGGLAPLVERAAELRAPILCANVRGGDGLVPAPFRTHCILRRGGVRVAVIGVTLESMEVVAGARRLGGMAFGDPAEALRRWVPLLRRRADVVVVLSHCGVGTDRQLARAVPGIDVIAGGHCHTLLPRPERAGDTWIVHAGSGGEHVAWLAMHLGSGSGGRRVGGVEGGVLPTAGVVPDALAERLAAEHAEDDGEIIGQSDVDLRRDDYAGETPAGNFVLDALRAHAGSDVALLKCSAINNSLPPGPIRRGEAARLCFWGEDHVAAMCLTGRQLRAVLDGGAREAYFLCAHSGARVVYDYRPGAPERVAEVTVAGAPLEAGRVYGVACSEGMARRIAADTGVTYEVLAETIGEVVVAAVLARGTIRPRVDGRLTLLGTVPRRRVPTA